MSHLCLSLPLLYTVSVIILMLSLLPPHCLSLHQAWSRLKTGRWEPLTFIWMCLMLSTSWSMLASLVETITRNEVSGLAHNLSFSLSRSVSLTFNTHLLQDIFSTIPTEPIKVGKTTTYTPSSNWSPPWTVFKNIFRAVSRSSCLYYFNCPYFNCPGLERLE